MGDYFKEEAIKMSFEFLTSDEWLAIPKEKLSVTVLKAKKESPGMKSLQRSGIHWAYQRKGYIFFPERITGGPAGETGPCRPDTEMFVDTGGKHAQKTAEPGCSCGKYFEVWNDVFMQYNKQKDGTYVPLTGPVLIQEWE